MEDKRLKRVFDQVKLSPEREEAMLADLLAEKKEVSRMKQTNRRRIPAAAFVAAVLVVVLAGTALAAGYFGQLDIEPVNGDYENGYKVTGAYQNISPEQLSEEVLEAAREGSGCREWTFDSWPEVEEFLGLEIADNAMLEEMAQSEWEPPHECDATPEEVRRCTVQMYHSLGSPDEFCIYSSYFGDYFEEGPFGVNVMVLLKVKTEEEGDIPVVFRQENIENVSEEQYVTPSGMEVTIITRDSDVGRLDGTSFKQSTYAAHFTLNNAMFVVYANFSEDTANSTLCLLKQVLDAYE